MQDLILVKPVSLTHYVTSKWVSSTLVAVVSYYLSMLAAYYYTVQLIGELDGGNVLSGVLVYSLWIVFLMTLVMFYSSFIKSSGGIAFLTLASAIILSLAGSLLTKWMMWSPSRLAAHSAALFTTGEPDKHFALSLTTTVGLILALLILTVVMFSGACHHSKNVEKKTGQAPPGFCKIKCLSPPCHHPKFVEQFYSFNPVLLLNRRRRMWLSTLVIPSRLYSSSLIKFSSFEKSSTRTCICKVLGPVIW